MIRFLGRTITRFAPGLCRFSNKQSRTHFNFDSRRPIIPALDFRLGVEIRRCGRQSCESA
jgi:hypothetical protein